MVAPRDLIDQIANEYAGAGQIALDALSGALDRLNKAFPRYGSFLMEFVQNADDAGSRTLKFEMRDTSITICNDGQPFSQEDVRSICTVGWSSKSAKDYIGYLGVGFKSVFVISKRPEIYSGEYNFKFDQTAWQEPRILPWQVMPVWIENPTLDRTAYSGFTTVFNLPLVPGAADRLRPEITAENLNRRVLLFLRHITEIEITDAAKALQRRIVRTEVSRRSGYEVQQIEEHGSHDGPASQEHWLVFRRTRRVPAHVRKDHMSKEWEREDVEKREIVIAFKLDEKGGLEQEKEGTAHIGVFSFLPLKEMPSGLSFLLQADLLTAPGRGELARDCLWNNWLADQMCDVILKSCVPTFLKHKKWRMNLTDVLYSGRGGHELFDKHVAGPLNEYLEDSPVLIAADGTPLSPADLIKVSDEMRALLGPDDLKLISPNKAPLHADCTAHPRLLVEQVPRELHEFISSSAGENVIRSRARKRDLEWFRQLYRTFVDRYDRWYFRTRHAHYNVEHDSFWNRMCRLHTPIILTNRHTVARIDECYVKPRNVRIPRHLTGQFKVVHPKIASDEAFRELRRKLNETRYDYEPLTYKVIPELSELDIRKALMQHEAERMDPKSWNALRPEERMARIADTKQLSRNYDMGLDEHDWLTLKSKGGQWVAAQNLVFPSEYLSPEHSIEALIRKGLLDLPIRFLSADFIERCTDNDEMRGWRRFFESLGVDSIVRDDSGGAKKRLVERVGILTALQYESHDNRTAVELGESRKPGYDIESTSEAGRRYVEVKSSGNKSLDVFLTQNEFKALRDHRDEYFIYIVLDALHTPILYATQGDALLAIEDTKLVIPFSTWKDVVEAEFQP